MKKKSTSTRNIKFNFAKYELTKNGFINQSTKYKCIKLDYITNKEDEHKNFIKVSIPKSILDGYSYTSGSLTLKFLAGNIKQIDLIKIEYNEHTDSYIGIASRVKIDQLSKDTRVVLQEITFNLIKILNQQVKAVPDQEHITATWIAPKFQRRYEHGIKKAYLA